MIRLPLLMIVKFCQDTVLRTDDKNQQWQKGVVVLIIKGSAAVKRGKCNAAMELKAQPVGVQAIINLLSF